MTCVEEMLRKDETILYQASVHWRVYLPGIILIILGISGIESPDAEGAASAIIFGLGWLVIGFIRRRTTELVVTDRRVISKTGWISRKSSEIDRPAVESILFRQSMLGRLLGYGTVEVRGRGGGIAPMKCIDNPVEFRNQVYLEKADDTGGEQARSSDVPTPLGTRPDAAVPATPRIQADSEGRDITGDDREPRTERGRPSWVRRVLVALALVIFGPIALLVVVGLFLPLDENPRLGNGGSNVTVDQRVLVTEVQRALKGAGFDPGPVDGVMGNKTRAAIRQFQEQNGLSLDGEVTPDLLVALKNVTGDGEQTTQGKVEISAEQFGDHWPFIVTSGVLECQPGPIVVFRAGGTTYGVNGLESARYPKIDPIWRDNPAIPGTKVSVGPVIQRGLSLCNGGTAADVPAQTQKSATLATAGEWYSGGTLHTSSLGQWQAASSSNRLATAGDLAAAILESSIRSGRIGSMDELKVFAQQLVNCINEVAVEPSLSSQPVSEMAAACMILMEWR